MEPEKILDNDFEQSIQAYLFEQEGIYPTFEMIPNVVKLQKKLEIFRIERIRKKAAEG